jgi:hypothetical protein
VAFILQSGCCGSTTKQVVLVKSPYMLLTASATKNPLAVGNSLSPASAIRGRWFPLPSRERASCPAHKSHGTDLFLLADYVSSTPLTAYVPASAVASAGTASIVVTSPAPRRRSFCPSHLHDQLTKASAMNDLLASQLNGFWAIMSSRIAAFALGPAAICQVRMKEARSGTTLSRAKNSPPK